jgi:hypothetical protein
MSTAHTNFPRLKSAGMRGAKVVGRDQLTKVGATIPKSSSFDIKGECRDRSRTQQQSQEIPLRKK